MIEILGTVVVAIVVFLLEHLVWILGMIGFVILCCAIGHIGNAPPAPRCPRHGCYLLPDRSRPERVQACYLCVDEEERRRIACRHCGGSLTGTHPFATLCQPCQDAKEAYEAAHPPDALRFPELDIPL